MAGVGFDAHTVANVPPVLKSKVGIGAYAWTVLRSFQTYSFSAFQVMADEKSFSATSCIIANARKYGGEFVFCPEADPADGMLDLVILQGTSRLKYMMFLASAGYGRPHDFKRFERCRARKIKIEGPEEIWVQVDGECAGHLPVEIELLPASVPLVVPAKK
jgi:diacylglycerol kinase family enzyme